MSYCLPKFAADTFKAKIKTGEINPEALSNMTSEERRKFFGGFLGDEAARHTNALFESKLLLAHQQQGIINWAKTVGGLKPEVQRDIIARVQKLDRVLNPTEEKKFLEDLASQKLGVGVTLEEAAKIAQLSKDVREAEAAQKAGGDRLDVGRAKTALVNYVNELKGSANKLGVGGFIKSIPGQAKSIKASLDDSAIFRQGWKTLFTHPTTWAKNALQSFSDLVRQFGGKQVLDEINADIVSRPTYDSMKKAKLAVGTREEAYPSSLPEKIPLLGRAYKASEAAYTGFVYRMRADVFDKYLEIAQKSGVDITDKKELESIGKLVNSLTGRGHLGGLEGGADFVNNVFFSPRFLKSNIDFLTAHQLQKGVTPFVRKEAAMNLIKVITGTAGVLYLAHALNPKAVDFDPRSADFGKIKIGNTRFDVTGGMSSIATLAARVAPLLVGQKAYSKSSTTGKLSEINSGKFGATTGQDVVVDFFANKLSPAGSVIEHLLTGQDSNFKKPTLLGEAENFAVPLPITNYMELKNDPKSANILVGMIADALGIGVNTYGPKK